MAWIASLASGIGSAIGSAGQFVGKAASGAGGGVGKIASDFHQGVGQGTGMWGGQPGSQPGGSMIKNPMTGGVTGTPQTGWGGVANKLGQLTGQYGKSQSPISFGGKSPTIPKGKKTAEEMLEELAGRR